jgi:hypothetical protein
MKIRDAAVVRGGEFTVDDRGAGGECCGGARNAGEARGEVVTAARINRDGTAALVDLDPPAVELDLVQPRVAFRRIAAQRG